VRQPGAFWGSGWFLARAERVHFRLDRAKVAAKRKSVRLGGDGAGDGSDDEPLHGAAESLAQLVASYCNTQPGLIPRIPDCVGSVRRNAGTSRILGFHLFAFEVCVSQCQQNSQGFTGSGRFISMISFIYIR